MLNARLRLASLWLSQTVRAVADWCLRIFVFFQAARAGGQEGESAWYLVTAIAIAPFILLAPFNGAISNGLPKRWVLVGSAGLCALVVAGFGALGGSWLWCLGLAAVGGAVYSPTRYALLPAAATDTEQPLPRVNGWIEMGGAAGIVAGMAVGYALRNTEWQSYQAAIVLSAALYGFAALAALPAVFPSDVRREEPPGAAVAGFFRDSGRVWRDGKARLTMLGLACFMALIAAGAGAVVAYILGRSEDKLLMGLMLVMLGASAGSWLAGLEGHENRVLGLVPYGAVGLLLALAWAAVASHIEAPCVLLGFMGGLTNVPLRAAFQAAVPADARGNGMAVSNTANYLAMTILSLLMFGLAHWGPLHAPFAQLGFLAVLALAGAVVSGKLFFRDMVEVVIDLLHFPFYRVHGHGPGLGEVPRTGPVLVVANHASWFDPIWLAKVLPRHLTAMMTSVFYDIPVMHWLVKRAFGAIRVEAARFRREAPELQEAVAALDRGECVLIFPEGMMRRSDDRPLRNFGQGVWHILSQRPQTPVVACWIEGGWGSYTSYKGGPPRANKRLDRARRIDVAVIEPQILSPEVLAEQRATRSYLMQACFEARRQLGLVEPAAPVAAEEPAEEGVDGQE